MQLSDITDGIKRFFGMDTEKGFFQSPSNYRIGQSGPVYIDTANPKKIFDENPQVNQVIRKKSSMFANMNLILVDKDGTQIDDPALMKLLENPNILQSQNEFLKQYLEQKDVYGNNFMYKSIASKLQKYPSSLALISPFYLKPQLTGKFYDQTELSGIISEYQLQGVGPTQKFATESIMWSRVPDLDNPLIGISPLKSLRFPITNSKLAYDYFNVISNEKGAIGILSTNTAKDGFGALPMTTEEKKKIESQYQKSYGLGSSPSGEDKMRVVLTEASLNWQPMTYPTQQLLLLEQIDSNFLVIIDHFGLNVNIFSSKNQTYENVKSAIIQCYQDTIFVEADQFTQSLTKFLGIPDGFKIVADYSHLQILKQDETAADFKTKSDAIAQLVNSNIITPLQAQEVLKNELKIQLDNAGGTVMDKLNLVSPLVANTLLANFTPNEARALVGLPKTDGGDVIPAPAPSF